jgi:hypothetical protein
MGAVLGYAVLSTLMAHGRTLVVLARIQIPPAERVITRLPAFF